MEGSSGFQGSMQADYQYRYQTVHQPMGQNQQFQGEHSMDVLTMQASDIPDEWMNFLGNESGGLKWTDEMARLLITAISYMLEAAFSENNGDASGRSLMHMPKMAKWKAISMAMGERGYIVSPQECEDKFIDIDNRYKQLIGILDRAMSCKVVENPILLDSIDIPEDQKEKVRKLLSSEQFLYREMCSLHHGNRLFLPHDWELRRSVILSLARNRDEQVRAEERNRNETGRDQNRRKVFRARWLQLEEKKLEIEQQRLQYEKERFEWLCFSHNKEIMMEKMRLENETLKLENARKAFELRRQEMSIADGNN